MRTFKNDYGCTMSFEEGISEQQIQMRVKALLGEKFYEVKE